MVMPVVSMKIKVKGLDAKTLRKIFKESYEALGRYWHDVILPKHFTQAGAHEYGYVKRGSKYMKRKLRVHGHQLPLVFSGELMEKVTRTRQITSTSRGARVKMQGTPYLYKFHISKQVKKAEELVRISRGDLQDMVKYFEAQVNKRIALRMGTRNITLPAAGAGVLNIAA